MKTNKKLKSTIVTTWTISTLLLLISLVIYILLVGIFKFDYFDFILPFSQVIILPIVVIFLNIIFVLNYEMETSSFKNFTIENLNVKGMMKNKKLSNAFQQIGLYYIVEWLKYKCQQYGVE